MKDWFWPLADVGLGLIAPELTSASGKSGPDYC
jgi:hypothetical protein